MTYTPDERRKAMRIHASQNGRRDLVEKMLRAEGLTMSTNTVRVWATHRYKDEYLEIRQEQDAYVRANAEEEIRAITSLAASVVAESLRQAFEELKRGAIDGKELTKVAQQAMVSLGISVEKSELLSGRPTQRIGSTGDITSELAAVGIQIVMPGQPERKPDVIDLPVRRALPEAVDVDAA